ncbi:hypothetical protein NKG94_30990 [Micromonospora sp. M12]
MAITPDGSRAYVANANSDDVSVIDTATNTVTATVPAGRGASGVAIASVTSPPAADLSAAVADSADPAALGGTYTYSTTITNNGPDNATGVNTTITLSGRPAPSCPPPAPRVAA